MDDGLNSPEITQEAKPISPYAAAWTTFNQRLCRSLWMRLPRPEWRGQPIVGYHLFISTSSSDSGTGVPPWCEPGNDGRSRRRVRSASRRQAVVNQPGGFAPMSPGSKAGPQSQPLRAAVNVEGRPLPQMPRRPVGTVIRAGSDGAGSTRVGPGSSRPDALTGQPGAADGGRVGAFRDGASAPKSECDAACMHILLFVFSEDRIDPQLVEIMRFKRTPPKLLQQGNCPPGGVFCVMFL